MFLRLAAVDMHTAQHIVQHCLSGELARDRTIILVTHHISLCLPIASYVVELSRGSIARAGDKEEFQDIGESDALNEVDDEETEVASSGTQTPDDNIAEDVLPKQRPSRIVKKLVEAEVRAEGRVPFRTYWVYIKAAGLMSWALTLVLMLMIRMINIGNQVLLQLLTPYTLPIVFQGVLGQMGGILRRLRFDFPPECQISLG
jgi:hypothetical protein